MMCAISPLPFLILPLYTIGQGIAFFVFLAGIDRATRQQETVLTGAAYVHAAFSLVFIVPSFYMVAAAG